MAFSAAAGRGVWAENAVDTLAAHFDRAHNSLLLIQYRLDEELSRIYGNDDVNPMKIQARLNKLQEELPVLEAECKRLLAAKQEFIEQTVGSLLHNKATLESLQARAGTATNNEDVDQPDESSAQSLGKILKEWKELKPL
ncbi:uncharacterized protein LOC112342485 isoform X2 [Selaginella moellendorffii]|uniref:uncharacterized protein LOC112342485 isoform X2 n=1 Tax=Selaginella moellendorffii TaxID=88036 RepID=UPI000D1CFD14|nr:uncharacterized protein LOC112342485 isoform X2 [Selaginella moellendorffii]|eukprot:XP_024520171.1 uncharacterized protein LOC112342485 isoform X2 [Selaginella moellendorffii]